MFSSNIYQSFLVSLDNFKSSKKEWKQKKRKKSFPPSLSLSLLFFKHKKHFIVVLVI